MDNELKIRERFEAWVQNSLYERSVRRLDTNSAWPDQYADYHVELAWQAWKSASVFLPVEGGGG